MIPQLGFAEIIILGLLALIVVGPKDLPRMMKAIGQFLARLRSLGQEFKSAFDEMGQAAEMEELRKEIEELKKLGKLENLSEEAFGEDMVALDRDLRDGTRLENPKSSPDTQKSDKPEDKD